MEACEAKRQKQVLNIVMCWVFKKDLRFIRVSSQKRENVMQKTPNDSQLGSHISSCFV